MDTTTRTQDTRRRNNTVDILPLSSSSIRTRFRVEYDVACHLLTASNSPYSGPSPQPAYNGGYGAPPAPTYGNGYQQTPPPLQGFNGFGPPSGQPPPQQYQQAFQHGTGT